MKLQIAGKYGYIDADGKTREISYGADKFGFQPSGEGITVSYSRCINYVAPFLCPAM